MQIKYILIRTGKISVLSQKHCDYQGKTAALVINISIKYIGFVLNSSTNVLPINNYPIKWCFYPDMSFLLSIPNSDFQMSISFIDTNFKKSKYKMKKIKGYQQCYT